MLGGQARPLVDVVMGVSASVEPRSANCLRCGIAGQARQCPRVRLRLWSMACVAAGINHSQCWTGLLRARWARRVPAQMSTTDVVVAHQDPSWLPYVNENWHSGHHEGSV